jgi:S-adenosylmethionine synthetase
LPWMSWPSAASSAQEQQIREFATQQLAELPALVNELVYGTVAVF